MNQITDETNEQLDLLRIIIKRKIFILTFTFLMTIIATIYIYFKNTIPTYNGTVMIEIGILKTKTTINNFTNIDKVNNLKHILEKQYLVSVSIPKKSTNLLLIKSSNTNKELIKKNLEDSIDFIIKRDEERVSGYDNYIMTKKITNIVIKEKQQKNKSMLIVAFITGLLLSIFLVFGFEAIIKKNNINK